MDIKTDVFTNEELSTMIGIRSQLRDISNKLVSLAGDRNPETGKRDEKRQALMEAGLNISEIKYLIYDLTK